MSIIIQLPRSVAERIAAGEVVERPASVVKELVENAIDAAARAVLVSVDDGGKGGIAVVDDGCGIEAEDLGLAVMRHATSKIKGEADLWNIGTMGFRGEALAAIGAVSRLAIESRPNRADAVEGARIEVEGGRVAGLVPAGCAGGTRVDVRDLFYNVPARLKFMRSAAVECGHISESVADLALAFPDIRFELVADGRRRFLTGEGDVEERVRAVLAMEGRGPLHRVEEGGGRIALSGWVAERGRAGARDVHVFVNRRPVRDRLLLHAVASGFKGILGKGEYPAAVLWLEMEASQVDVNVHPTKREVRFSNGGAVHDFVAAAIGKVVVPRDVVSRPSFLPPSTGGSRREGDPPLPCPLPQGEREFRCSFEMKDTLPLTLRPLGQIASTYVVCEGKDSALVLIDQHAAHERLGFEELLRQHARGKVAQQRLLIPERVELGERRLAYIAERLGEIRSAGFEAEPFGGGTLLVKATPSVLGGASVAALFEKLAAEFEELGTSAAVDDVLRRIFSVVACHRQVRAGDALSREELAALARDVEREGVTHCPHGRPAVVRIEGAEVGKWFKRSL